MLAYISTLLFFFAETGGQAAENAGWYDTYFNYPGFEAWRFLNLGVFVLIMFYLLKKPLSKAFKDKRDAIRSELIKAEEAKKAAAAELEIADAKLAGLASEKAKIIAEAESEAAVERKRIEAEADNDIARVQNQSNTEVSRKTAQVNVQLRRFSAEESVRLAEEKIKGIMDDAKDADLVSANIKSIGGLR